jgi:hypothetical protein
MASTGSGNLVAVSVFSFKGAYRPSSQYAKGLVWVSEAVKTHLPGFRLRIYADASVDPSTIQFLGEDPSSATIWSDVWRFLESQAHVDVVWYHYQPLAITAPQNDGSGQRVIGHTELFGTFARFLPMLSFPPASSPPAPSWVASPPEGATVFTCDADFGDYPTEHLALHAVSWYASLPWQAAGAVSSPVPAILGLTAAGSTAARHEPDFGLPPFYSGLLASRRRWPYELLSSFLAGAVEVKKKLASGKSEGIVAGESGAKTLIERYLSAIHDPSKQNYTYQRRGIKDQRCLPFGCDEFWLTNTLKPFALKQAAGESGSNANADHWLFLTLPSVDTEMRALISILKAHLQASAPLNSASKVGAIFTTAIKALASAAGVNLKSTGRTIDLALLEEASKEWPKKAADSLGCWKPFGTALSASGEDTLDKLLGLGASEDTVSVVGEGLRVAAQACLAGFATGEILHSTEDMALVSQLHAHFSRSASSCLRASSSAGASRSAIFAWHEFILTEGAAQRVSSKDNNATAGYHLMQALEGRTHKGCGVTKPYLPSSLPKLGEKVVATAGAGAGTTAAVPQAQPPAPAAAAPPSDWVLQTSRSKGMQYWFNSKTNVSLWHDPSLPAGWGWNQASADAPRFYVCLATGERRDKPPAAADTSGVDDGSSSHGPPAAKRMRKEGETE